MEQLGRAGTVPLRPRLLVAPQLPHRLRFPDLHERRRLRFHHYQRDAVDEEHEVGDDHTLVVLGAAPLVASADAELGRNDKLVEAALRVIEVEEARDARSTATRFVDAEGHAVGEVLVDGLIAGHARDVHVLQREDGAVGLPLRHPLVEPQQRPLQPPSQQYLSLVYPLRRQLVARHVRPAEPLQQHARGLLGVVVLVEFGGGGHEVCCVTPQKVE